VIVFGDGKDLIREMAEEQLGVKFTDDEWTPAIRQAWKIWLHCEAYSIGIQKLPEIPLTLADLPSHPQTVTGRLTAAIDRANFYLLQEDSISLEGHAWLVNLMRQKIGEFGDDRV
jgi:hypothetical protein